MLANGQKRPARVGWLCGTTPRSRSFFVAFEQQLRDLGHVDGENLVVDCAFAKGRLERLAPMARALVARGPDVHFVGGPE